MGTRPANVVRSVFRPIRAYVDTEVFSGVVLLIAAIAALVLANSPLKDAYHDLFSHVVTIDFGLFTISDDVQHLINEGPMTLFFFVVGLEIKREVFRGDLAGRDRAMLPVFAALGGMAAPALIYTLVNFGGDAANGWGIPMATDIAFALGVVALLGRRIPSQLRVFLLAMAIADDMGSILVIVLFYSDSVDVAWLYAAIAIVIGAYGLRFAGVRNILAYVPVGLLLWLTVYQSGVSTTLAGIMLAMLTPLHPDYGPSVLRENLRTLAKLIHSSERRDADLAARPPAEGESPLERLEVIVHPWASYLIVPLFALANAGVSLSSDSISNAVSSPATLGIVLGRLIGKPLGIMLFSWLAVRARLASLPQAVDWRHMLGVGMLGGVGFTVALYVNDVAFDDPSLIDEGKIGIMVGSVLAGTAAYLTLRAISRPSGTNEEALLVDEDIRV